MDGCGSGHPGLRSQRQRPAKLQGQILRATAHCLLLRVLPSGTPRLPAKWKPVGGQERRGGVQFSAEESYAQIVHKKPEELKVISRLELLESVPWVRIKAKAINPQVRPARVGEPQCSRHMNPVSLMLPLRLIVEKAPG